MTRAILALAAVLVMALPPALASAATQFAGLTNANQILLFRSDSPGNLQGSAAVVGLQTGERLLGIDVRPADGRLYALGSSNRVYVVNPVTGVATTLTNTPFSPALNGDSFTFAIDGSNDQARVISNTGQNLRISVANGQVVGVDAPYQYAPNDVAAGNTPNLAAIAYSVAPLGGGSPSLYGLDVTRDALVSAATNAATVRTIGALGVSAGIPAALDITDAGLAYAALAANTVRFPSLYAVDLSTGLATPTTRDPAGSVIAYRLSSTTSADTPIIAMAALGFAPDDEARPQVSISSSSSQLNSTLLDNGVQFTVACSEACGVSATVSGVGETSQPVTGNVLATAGNVRLRIRLSADQRRAIRERGSVRFTLRVTVTDAAGNSLRQTRTIRSRTG